MDREINCYFGPMEGVTTALFRGVHHRLFGGCDRYYMPFISPTAEHLFTPRELREVSPERNKGIPVVPQLLGKNGEDLLWAVRGLREMGYKEVNLNTGCPSATVTAKGKGAGLLRTPDVLDRMLDTVFSGLDGDISVSVKTRIGYASPDEFPALLAIFEKYPISELTVHPRTRKDMYEPGTIRMDAFDDALAAFRERTVYNGDLSGEADIRRVAGGREGLCSVMLSRGAAADPALFRTLRGGAAAGREELRRFHDELYETYRAEMGRQNAMRRMRELWGFMLSLFEGGEEHAAKLRRMKDTDRFEELIEAVFRELPLKKE